ECRRSCARAHAATAARGCRGSAWGISLLGCCAASGERGSRSPHGSARAMRAGSAVTIRNILESKNTTIGRHGGLDLRYEEQCGQGADIAEGPVVTPMYGPAVRCKRFSSIWQTWPCINVSGL